jgi:hypothetical protein
VTLEPVSGAQVYLDYVGYVANGDTVIVPLESVVYHKANVGSTWSNKTSQTADGTWTACIYQWDGIDFISLSYE